MDQDMENQPPSQKKIRKKKRRNSLLEDDDYLPSSKKDRFSLINPEISHLEASYEECDVLNYSLENDHAGMNISDSLDHSISDDEPDPYDSDLYIDDQDCYELSVLSEAKREEILFQRSENRRQIQERNSLKSKLRFQMSRSHYQSLALANSYQHEKKSKLNHGSDTYSGTKKNEALSDLRAQREKKQHTVRSQTTLESSSDFNSSISSHAAPKSSAQSYFHDSYSSTPEPSFDSCFEVDTSSSKPISSKSVHLKHMSSGGKWVSESEIQHLMDKDETSFQDLAKITVNRDLIISWIGEPYWDRTIRGIFVRACVGQNTLSPIYRLAEIVDAIDNEDSPSYKLYGREYRLKLVLSIGDAMRELTLECISNQVLLEEEYNDWKKLVFNQGVALPTRADIQRIAANIDTARNYIRTWEDIDRKVAENTAKNKRDGKIFPTVIYSPALRKRTHSLLERAIHCKDHTNIKRYESELIELDKLHELEKQHSVIALANAELIQSINQKNRGKNSNIGRSYVPESTILEAELNPFARRPTYGCCFSVGKQKLATSSSNISQSKAKQEPLGNQVNSLSEYHKEVKVDLDFNFECNAAILSNQIVTNDIGIGPKATKYQQADSVTHQSNDASKQPETTALLKTMPYTSLQSTSPPSSIIQESSRKVKSLADYLERKRQMCQ